MSTEQEYDAQADMIDDIEGDELESDNFIPNFRLPATTSGVQGLAHMAPAMDGGGGPSSHMIDHYDPMLDADPFGLTASMHFPNAFPRSEQVRR